MICTDGNPYEHSRNVYLILSNVDILTISIHVLVSLLVSLAMQRLDRLFDSWLSFVQHLLDKSQSTEMFAEPVN